MNKIIQKMFNITKAYKKFSVDPVPVVATAWRNGVLLGYGVNEYPSKIKYKRTQFVDNTDFDLDYTIHAEINCILDVMNNRTTIDNAEIFVYGVPVCNHCALVLIGAGVSKVYQSYPEKYDNPDSKWYRSHQNALIKFNEAGVEIERVKYE